MRFEAKIIETAKQYPHAIALTEWDGNQWQEKSYAALIQAAQQFSDQLNLYHIKKGERVILITHNRIQGVVALLGIWLAKATAVLIDPDLPESACLQHCQIADARFFIVEKEITQTVRESVNAKYLIEITDCDFIWHEKKVELTETIYEDCSESIATLIFTSGTTGDYKSVILTHANYLYLSQFYQHFSEQDGCMLTVLPLFHVAGLFCGFLQPLCLGVNIVFFRAFSAESFQSAFSNYHPTILLSVPRLLEMIHQKIQLALNEKGKIAQCIFKIFIHTAYFSYRYLHVNMGKIVFRKIHHQFGGCLKRILCGSAQLSAHLQKQFLSLGFDLYCSYGLTETCGPITFTIYQHRFRLGSVGRCDEINNLTISTEGEVLYRGPALMSGYFRDHIATAEVIRDGYFHTRDLGKLDRHNNLYIEGRLKEVIVFSDGKKAFPEQIEKQYALIPGIKEYAVFGVTERDATFAVLAFVPNQIAESLLIKSKLFQRASHLKSPFRITDVFFTEKIPRSSTLKVKRHLLAEHYLSGDASRDDLVEKISQCFKVILSDKKEWITPDITFAELGIDSLLAAQLCEIINAELHLSINPTEFWFSSTIRELALSVRADKKSVKNSVRHPNEKIAIVAQTGVFPGGAKNIDIFWKNLLSGNDAIVAIPASRWDVDTYYDEYALAPGKTNSRWGGFIDLPDYFPLSEFGLKPAATNEMDPRQKIVLLQVQSLLKNNAKTPKNTGFFIGAGFPDFMIHAVKTVPLTKMNPYSGMGIADFSLASRVAYHFGFEGPAMVINTACSSALVAVHQAVRALQHHDCDAAIAGGINVILEPDISVLLTKGGFLSPEGRCKSFDANANGYVRSEACGLVLLKRYVDAKRDHDSILAVIAGSAINQDGASTGLTAPNGNAQIACYEAALARAEIQASEVDFIEANGGATQLGDAIEMQSIQRVYDQQRNKNKPLLIGAVKSNIGNGESAAGIAALIKTVCVLQHQMVPPNLHYHHANPNIDLQHSAVCLPTTVTRFQKPCLVAAVSAFGIAGTNVHIIMEVDT